MESKRKNLPKSSITWATHNTGGLVAANNEDHSIVRKLELQIKKGKLRIIYIYIPSMGFHGYLVR